MAALTLFESESPEIRVVEQLLDVHYLSALRRVNIKPTASGGWVNTTIWSWCKFSVWWISDFTAECVAVLWILPLRGIFRPSNFQRRVVAFEFRDIAWTKNTDFITA